MYYIEEECCCTAEQNDACCSNDNDNGCNCDEGCDCDDGCDCGHDHAHDHDHGAATIVMTDAETGEEYTFMIVDDFQYEDDHYCVLITTDEQEPEMVITKVVTMEDGTEGLMSLGEDEYDKVYTEYERLCEEEDYEIEDDEE